MNLGPGSGSDEVYKGNWFAFNSLTFLLDKMKPRSTSDAGMEVSNMICHSTLILFYIIIVYTFYTDVANACVRTYTVCTYKRNQHAPNIMNYICIHK